VGKSTLFNALLKQQAALAANYPFATIEPNVGVVPVPDERLPVLAEIVHTKVIKPATVEFVDIAGLVKGASQGEGLGNQFLANIRETAAICHVIRAFDNPDIIREGAVSPQADLATIRIELQLADLATLQKQTQPKGATDKKAQQKWAVMSEFKTALENGNSLVVNDELKQSVAKELCLLTAKPELFVLNVDEAKLSQGVDKLTQQFAQELSVKPGQVIVMCAQIEAELSSLAEADQRAYLQDLGLDRSGLDRLIRAAYQLLGLQSFLTAGEKEVRAWTIKQGCTAPEAAGVIHTDFLKKFIMAKVASYQDFVQHQGWKELKSLGKIRQEGREYVMQEGDVVEFAIGA